MWIGTAVALSAAALYFLLGRWYGAIGLASAGVTGMTANALATLVLLRAWYGGPSLAALAKTVARAIAISAVAGAAAGALPPLAEGRWGTLLDLALGGAAFAIATLVGIQLFGDDAQRDALRRLSRRRR
jgi:peptidoglycan biosynthesis protein MviN/MurJ (putative lipid II flippase)